MEGYPRRKSGVFFCKPMDDTHEIHVTLTIRAHNADEAAEKAELLMDMARTAGYLRMTDVESWESWTCDD